MSRGEHQLSFPQARVSTEFGRPVLCTFRTRHGNGRAPSSSSPRRVSVQAAAAQARGTRRLAETTGPRRASPGTRRNPPRTRMRSRGRRAAWRRCAASSTRNPTTTCTPSTTRGTGTQRRTGSTCTGTTLTSRYEGSQEVRTQNAGLDFDWFPFSQHWDIFSRSFPWALCTAFLGHKHTHSSFDWFPLSRHTETSAMGFNICAGIPPEATRSCSFDWFPLISQGPVTLSTVSLNTNAHSRGLTGSRSTGTRARRRSGRAGGTSHRGTWARSSTRSSGPTAPGAPPSWSST